MKNKPKLNIIYEDERIIVINKSAGIIVEENPFEKVNSQAMVQQHLNKNSRRTKPPYLGVIHRLDRVTSGVLLFAKKKSLLKEINEDFRKLLYVKRTIILPFSSFRQTRKNYTSK